MTPLKRDGDIRRVGGLCRSCAAPNGLLDPVQQPSLSTTLRLNAKLTVGLTLFCEVPMARIKPSLWGLTGGAEGGEEVRRGREGGGHHEKSILVIEAARQ